VRQTWAAHEPHDIYLTMREVHVVCVEILPAAKSQNISSGATRLCGQSRNEDWVGMFAGALQCVTSNWRGIYLIFSQAVQAFLSRIPRQSSRATRLFSKPTNSSGRVRHLTVAWFSRILRLLPAQHFHIDSRACERSSHAHQ
jgi:hypothetical protein